MALRMWVLPVPELPMAIRLPPSSSQSPAARASTRGRGKLDRFDLIILDDITYAHKDQAETSVLFELIARRYEYRSIAIAANQPFSGWDQIFPDKAMTVAAIDRLVHHATILEMNAQSFRQRAATANKRAGAETPATTSNDNQNKGAD